MRQAARQVVRSSWEEAHGTQYYKHDRSMVERSINHPYIGLYPASYMWGEGAARDGPVPRTASVRHDDAVPRLERGP